MEVSEYDLCVCSKGCSYGRGIRFSTIEGNMRMIREVHLRSFRKELTETERCYLRKYTSGVH